MSGPGDALDVGVVASAPGKLILTGEYAVLDGAPALVIAVDRRVTARLAASGEATGASPFLTAVAEELARRGLAHAATAARRVLVDSTALYEGATKLGLGSSAAVTVAATALALAASAARGGAGLDRAQVLAIAAAAHAAAQGAKGARGSGADIAAATLGGVLEFVVAERGEGAAPRVTRRAWPTGVRLIPFFTGTAADTVTLVAAVTAARARDRVAVDAALAAVTTASRTACAACAAPPALAATALLGALALAAHATDRLAAATGVPLVPGCVTAARAALAALGGTAKTTGAGAGDIGIAVLPVTADVSEATRALIQAGCQPLSLRLDETGVDLNPIAS